VQIGVTFPQTEIGSDPADIRQYAESVEALGYRSILAYDHVLGASTATRPDWSGPYTSETAFHEIFVLFGYLAAITRHVDLVTGVVILPQRQTALVAKQAVEIDVLSGGRLRLGIGVGWNAVEYEALDANFRDRGVRSEEQIAVMRALWAEPVVDLRGRWHTIDHAGINPLPPRRSIPVWIGGYAEETLRRIGRIGDGWIIFRTPDATLAQQCDRLRGYAAAAGRDPASIGIEGQISLARVPAAQWAEQRERWQQVGAATLTLNTMGMGLRGAAQHLEALRHAAAVLGVGR
jgi:probable F420-dependent oxidoreductase